MKESGLWPAFIFILPHIKSNWCFSIQPPTHLNIISQRKIKNSMHPVQKIIWWAYCRTIKERYFSRETLGLFAFRIAFFSWLRYGWCSSTYVCSEKSTTVILIFREFACRNAEVRKILNPGPFGQKQSLFLCHLCCHSITSN